MSGTEEVKSSQGVELGGQREEGGAKKGRADPNSGVLSPGLRKDFSCELTLCRLYGGLVSTGFIVDIVFHVGVSISQEK